MLLFNLGVIYTLSGYWYKQQKWMITYHKFPKFILRVFSISIGYYKNTTNA